ncbi:MAG: rhodanese-like domain-containing protein [Gemmataceae bacterium]|jgi:phage shock protein E
MRQFAWVIPAAVASVGVACAADHTTDSLDTVKKSAKDGKALIVDVREQSEWDDGHLEGAKLLPLSDLKAGVSAEKLKEKLGDAKVLYLHCGSGKRCLAAADLLKKQGYDVRPLKDGFQALVKAGFEKAK